MNSDPGADSLAPDASGRELRQAYELSTTLRGFAERSGVRLDLTAKELQLLELLLLHRGEILTRTYIAESVWEMSFAKMPENAWHIATERVKWSAKYQEKHGIDTGEAALTYGAASRVQHLAKRVFRALDLTGYARIDLRMAADGRLFVIEANPNPQLAQGEDFAQSAKLAKVSYGELLDRIMGLGLQWQPERTAYRAWDEAVLATLQSGSARVPILRVMATASIVLGESSSNELRSGNTLRLARRLVYTYAGCLAHLRAPGRFVRPKDDESVAALALRALGGKPTPPALAAVNALLVLCADHELSPATYAARVVASSGAGVHACLIAAITGHSGHRLGGGCDRVEDFFSTRHTPARLREMATAAARGEASLPGFGSALYPEGDPRVKPLLDMAVGLAAPKALADIQQLVEIAQTEPGLPVSLEVGLVAMARALGLPPRSASALWAVGRSVGWVAHVMEQRLAGGLIRPRARRLA